MPHHGLHRLWCDQEDLGKKEEHRFKSELVKVARAHGVEKFKVSVYPSHKSDLIQLADVTAYALSWNARKHSEPEVLRALHAIQKNASNVIMGPTKWGE